MADNDGKVLDRARGRLQGGRLWHQGSLRGPDGSACLVGALLDAATGQREVDRVAYLLGDVIQEQYPDLPGVAGSRLAALPTFNDHPDTTWADVDLVLDKAARRLDEAL